MSFSTRHLLVVFLYVCFGLAALINIDSPYFATVVQWLVIGTLISSLYRGWQGTSESRAFHFGFATWGALYLVIVAVIAHWHRYGGSIYIFRPARMRMLPPGVADVPWVVDTFERASHYLASLAMGLVGGCVSGWCYRTRQRMLARR